MEVVTSPDQGRFLRATRSYTPGEVILQEKPFVYATWHEFNCLVCEEFHEASQCAKVRSVFPRIAECVAEVEQALMALEKVEEIDRARTVLKCLALFEESAASRERLKQTFEALAVANEEPVRKSLEVIPTHPLLKKILPEGCSLDLLAKIVGGLNTNCHTLEDLGGSGLFEKSCICQHSCVPNCNFSTSGTLLTLTATKCIGAGESLTLDYGENFFKPTSFRKQFLQESYGFLCACPACSGQLPDKSRSFLCPKGTGPDHVIFPPQWTCGCGYALTPAEIQTYCEWEQQVDDSAPEELEDVQLWMMKPENVLHKHHYIFFEVIDECAHELALECTTKDECVEQELELVWRMLLDFVEFAVPEDNPIRVNYYDEFAQVYVKLGNLPDAKAYYTKAYELAKKLIGPEEMCAATRKLKALSEEPPKSVEDLYKHYANVSVLEKELEYERMLEESVNMMDATKLS